MIFCAPKCVSYDSFKNLENAWENIRRKKSYYIITITQTLDD